MAMHRNQRTSLSISIKKERDIIRSYLEGYNPKLCNRLHEPITTLSGGERQTLAFAMSLWGAPQLLLLDEHTSALDPQMSQKLMHLTNEVVRLRQVTTIVATHHLEDALQYGNRLIAMNKGRIILDLNLADKSRLTREDLLSIY